MSTVVWKHIGLRSHSVGSFSCEPEKIVWKSAMTMGAGADEHLDVSRVIPSSQITGAQWTVFGRSGHVRVQTKGGGGHNSNLKHELRFDGFPANDFETLKAALQNLYHVTLKQHNMSSAGAQYGLTNISGRNLVFRHCVLDEMNEEGQEFEPRAEDEMLSLDLAEVSQCVLPGNNRNEIELQFPESDTIEAGTDQLVAIRMYVPPDPEADPADKVAPTAAELLQQRIMQSANIRKTTGDVIVQFDPVKGTFLTPRGRYQIELYDYYVRLRGQKYDYKIKYEDISRLFLLPKPDEVHMAFVIGLDKPIRQGQQRYQFLVLQASKENDEVLVNLEEEVLQKEYNGELQPVMRGSLANLIAKTFKVVAKKKVFIPGKFANANQQACVKCAVRANEGLLYPLEKQFVFIHKPTILVRFNEIESVEFQRYAGGQGSTRNFDLQVNLKEATSLGGSSRDYTFSGIDRSDYQGLYNFLSGKKIPIKNIQGDNSFLEDEVTSTKKPLYNEDEIFGGPVGGGDDEEGSDDEDYDEAAAAKEEAERAAEVGSEDESDDDDDDDIDDDEMGSEVDEELDSDLEEARKTTKRKSKKGGNDGDDDDDDSEEEETPKKKKTKKAKSSDDASSPAKKTKTKKDPNAPKRATTAYFVFCADQRERIKKANPGVGVTEIAKLLGVEWKELSAEQKVKYEKMAKEDKVRYEREMKDYVPPEGAGGGGKGGPGKKKKEKKDPNAPKRAMTSFFYFSNEMRPKVKERNPELSFGDLGKRIGEMFRELSPEEKEKYEKMAREDKSRFKRETSEYDKKSKQAKDDEDSDADGVKEEVDDEDDGIDEDSD